VTTDKVRRAPVVTIMGHVDHGKTSLLDAIVFGSCRRPRSWRHHAAHRRLLRREEQSQKSCSSIRPANEAFTRMRARRAKVTDIVHFGSWRPTMASCLKLLRLSITPKPPGRPSSLPSTQNGTKARTRSPKRIKQQLSDRGLVPEGLGRRHRDGGSFRQNEEKPSICCSK